MRHWNWDEMVEANRVRLIGLLAGLFVLLGSGDRVTRVVWRQVLARLVPMESALRRLIFVMARDLTVTLPPVQTFPGMLPKGTGAERKPVFRLTDQMRDPDPKRRSAPGVGPRVLYLDEWRPLAKNSAPTDDDLIDSAALRRRLAAMKAALDDLPGQAMRLARWYARRDRKQATGSHSREYPIRSGRAPGHRKGGKRDVDELLAACQELALRCRAMAEAEGR